MTRRIRGGYVAPDRNSVAITHHRALPPRRAGPVVAVGKGEGPVVAGQDDLLYLEPVRRILRAFTGMIWFNCYT